MAIKREDLHRIIDVIPDKNFSKAKSFLESLKEEEKDDELDENAVDFVLTNYDETFKGLVDR
jgi:hypothetical protein